MGNGNTALKFNDEAPFFSAFDTLLDGVVVVCKEEKIVYSNAAFSTFINTSHKRIRVGSELTNFITFFPKLYKTELGLKTIKNPTPYKAVKYVSKKGGAGEALVSIQPFSISNNDDFWIYYLRDEVLEASLQKRYRNELDEKNKVIHMLKEAQKSLRDYSNNLEVMVQDRTSELSRANQMLNAMINCLGQGFLVFDKQGLCSDIYSRASLQLLETDPTDKSIESVLQIPAKEAMSFTRWFGSLFEEKLPFNDLAGMGPKNYPHSGNRNILLSYYPLRDASEGISKIVVVATDKTEAMAALQQAEEERLFVKRILKLAKNKEVFGHFIQDAELKFSEIRILIQNRDNWTSRDLLRIVHTLKGDASIYLIDSLVKCLGELEDILSQIGQSPNEKDDGDQDKIEMILKKSQIALNDYLEEHRSIIGPRQAFKDREIQIFFRDLASFHERLSKDRVLAEAFEADFLREPIGRFLGCYDDLISKIARETGKRVHPLILKGGDLKVIAEPYLEVFDTFVHLISNAVEYGIETPTVRKNLKKDPMGRLTIEVLKLANSIQIVFQDDGSGINPEIIKAKLGRPKGAAASTMTDKEAIDQIFTQGFTTKDSVSLFSGRGVGLSAVQESVERLKGNLRVETKPNQGSRFIVEIPAIDFKKSK